MPKRNLRDLVEYNERTFLPKVLVDQPGYRLVLLNIRGGQSVPGLSTRGVITVYVISGHITFHENDLPVDLRAGEVLWIRGGLPHRIEANDDSSLLVVAAFSSGASDREIDLCEIPHVKRHPLVFAEFDELAVGESFVLIDDHDPVHLNKRMELTRPKQLAWEYITRGPDVFRIRVRRIAQHQLSEVATGNNVDSLLAI